ncbi:hypothetical protein ACFVVM_24705 [Nocardia sp. NPDC058176]|uniref:hypothetical protein n=1 Tax=Nocardia sp. NPDC058176 TaxID=3346368 RepID=UPI0036DBD7AB
MFTLHDSHSSNQGDGPAVEDELTRSTGKALGAIMAAARAWIHNQRGRSGGKAGAGVPKLTRKERKELAEAIRIQVGEQKIAAAWYSKRVGDYQSEVLAANARRREPGYTNADADRDDERLAGIRYRIESTLHETPALSLERRGQVVQALDGVGSSSSRPYGAVFKPMTPEQQHTARLAAVHSEQWVIDRRQENQRILTAQQERERAAADQRAEMREPRAWDELNAEQQSMVQRLRRAHLGVDVNGRRLDPDVAEVAQENSIKVARASGLTRREVGAELGYLAENTAYIGSYGDDQHKAQGFYPSREQALAEMKKAMTRNPVLAENNVWASVTARPDGIAARDVERRSAFGERGEVIASVGRWSRDREPEYTGADTPYEVAVARIEPGTGKVLHSEISTLGSEVAALDYAHRGVMSAGPSVARTRVEVTDPRFPESPYYTDYGLPKTVSDRLADERVAVREHLLGESEATRELLDNEHHSLRQRHSLSIEHNGELTDSNAELTRRLSAMTAERDQALAERDSFRGQRDEAVAKLAERTPAEKRFGSPERQAAEAGRSALADYAPGNAVTAAVERTTERDGAQR